MSNSVSMDDVVAYLNELIQLDRPAMEALFEYLAPCDKALAGHSTMRVLKWDSGYRVGMLGVLNGLFGSGDKGRITLCWEGNRESNSLTVKRILLLDEGVDPNEQ